MEYNNSRNPCRVFPSLAGVTVGEDIQELRGSGRRGRGRGRGGLREVRGRGRGEGGGVGGVGPSFSANF